MPKVAEHFIQLNTTQQDFEVRREGEYLIVPVVMMTPGVRNGSGGPILHMAEYYGANPEDWDGVPLTAMHPQTSNGEYVSVNSENIDRSHWVVGHVRNTRLDGDRLKAEAWIKVQQAIAVNPEVVNYINEGKPLEVSIGAMTYDLHQQGIFENEEYHSITTMYHPDHLALLPGSQGACNWQDGCGIRNNEQNKEDNYAMSKITEAKKKLLENVSVLNELQANETGFMEISSRIQSMLDRRDSEAQFYFLKELYDDYFIYEVRNRDQGTQKFYKQAYSFDESSNDVDWEGERTEVRQNVQYIPLQANDDGGCGCGGTTMKRTKFNNNTNKDDEDSPMSNNEPKNQPSGEVQEKVVGLIANERTRFTKSDRGWLLNLNGDQLDALEPMDAPEVEVTREKALEALSEDLQSLEKVTEIVSDSIKEKIETGVATYEKAREELIKAIQANTEDGLWTEERLEKMDTEDLQSLSKSVAKVDYSGAGPVGGGNPQANADDGPGVLLPAGVQPKSKSE